MAKGRLEAFSDGVIAIIITITILIIDLPDGDDMRALMRIMPLVICYLITFIMVGVNWVIRVSYAYSIKNITEALRRLERYISSHS